jgi:CRP-like cAMP-binding protein
VLAGRVRVERGADVLVELGHNECLGEMALLDSVPRSATVVAVDDTDLLRIDGEDFLDLVADAPEILRGILRVLLARLRGVGGTAQIRLTER